MNAWTIIPVKHLRTAKSSLSSALGPEHRRQLVLAMLVDMLNIIHKAPSISRTAVVSSDKKVLNFARIHGAVGIVDHGPGLNGALKTAIKHVLKLGATSVLILPGDLPLLETDDVENINSMATAQRDVVIVPSKANGTNALLLKPPDIIDLRFGGESFPLHVAEAMKVGVRPRIYRSQTVTFDIDEPVDLLKVETSGVCTSTKDFLLSLKQK